MKKMLLALFIMIASTVLVACGGESKEKLDEATVATYTEKAEEVITFLLEKDFESVHAMLDANMQAETTLDDMSKYGAVIDEAGPFKGFDRSSVQQEKEQIVVATVAYHSEAKRIYSLTFNEQDEITAIYIK